MLDYGFNLWLLIYSARRGQTDRQHHANNQ